MRISDWSSDVCSSDLDDDGAFAANEKFLQQLRQRAMTQLVIENKFRFRIAARNGVADDDQIRFVFEIRFPVTVHHLDFPFREERGHRRINILVRAGDGETFFHHRRRRRCHRRAADADEVNGFDFG